MKMVRCIKGHYYDAEKNPQCPQCSSFSIFGGNIEKSNQSNIAAKDDVKTISYAQQIDEGVTVAFNSYSDSAHFEEAGCGSLPFTEKSFMPVVGWLVCMSGPERGRDYRLTAGRNFIGRDISMDICIREDMSVSRTNHASIIFDDRSRRAIVMGGDSTSTLVNGEEIYAPIDLRENDHIRIGESEFCYVPFCTEERDWGEKK